MPLPEWAADLRSLELLLAVAETGSVGNAARAHGMTQPSASARLARLERALGVDLLVRSPRGTTLTPGGEAVAAWAHTLVESAAGFAGSLAALRVDREARLRIAASLTVAEYLLPGWLVLLRRTRPELGISASVANSSEVLARLTAGDLDVGFVESPTVPDGVASEVVGHDRLTLVVTPDYPAAARADRALTAAEIVDLALVLREPGSGTRETFDAGLAAALQHPPDLRHVTALGSTATVLATVRAGAGVGVVSGRAVEGDVAAGRLVELTTTGVELRRPLRAVWIGAHPTGPAAELITLARAADPRRSRRRG